jgi:hypothetical protein
MQSLQPSLLLLVAFCCILRCSAVTSSFSWSILVYWLMSYSILQFLAAPIVLANVLMSAGILQYFTAFFPIL